MRTRVSRLAYGMLARSGVPRLWRSIRPGAAVFCFHNVVDPAEAGVGDRSLHLPSDRFENVIDWIGATYDVVPLSEIVRRVDEDRPLGGLASLTFDDAYRGVFENAFPILERRGFPATVFVVSGAASDPRFFWWDVAAEEISARPGTRSVCLDVHRGDGVAVLEALGAEGRVRNGLPSAFLPASWEMVRGAVSIPEFAVGAHTVTHRNLSALTWEEKREELTDCRRQIREHTGHDPTVVCYPYGLYDVAAVEEARAAGYRGGLTLDPGPIRRGAPSLELPRVSVPAGISLPALECWAAGLRPPGAGG